ncbi:sugar transferase [Yoonia sp.]|uniref:sugar transferase n=1 Tax=Yoonia sp. TaxID=2212373 RepID=UPI003F6BFDD9
MFDFQDMIADPPQTDIVPGSLGGDRRVVRAGAKRAFDVVIAIVLLLPLSVFALAFCALNPFFNRGPLLFRQDRMGYQCRPFVALKFRTMTTPTHSSRGAFDTLETDRITPLGRFMRKTRIDELPQIFNVLRGQMSLIGPRPDSLDHARIYLRVVPGYHARHQVVPGISGFAQTEIGYVDGLEGVHRKVAADLHYIGHATLAFDLWIAWRTLVVIIAQRGR